MSWPKAHWNWGNLSIAFKELWMGALLVFCWSPEVLVRNVSPRARVIPPRVGSTSTVMSIFGWGQSDDRRSCLSDSFSDCCKRWVGPRSIFAVWYKPFFPVGGRECCCWVANYLRETFLQMSFTRIRGQVLPRTPQTPLRCCTLSFKWSENVEPLPLRWLG